MDMAFFWLGIVSFCLSLLTFFYTIRKIRREYRRNGDALPGELRYHWYANFLLRRNVEASLYIGLLALICFGFFFTQLNRKLLSPFFPWLMSSFSFLTALHQIFTTFSEEYERRKISREAGETPGRWWASVTLHRGLAFASIWIGILLPPILIHWDFLSRLSSNPADVFFWLDGFFIGLSGLYWLSTYIAEFLPAYLQGGWAGVERAVLTRSHKTLPQGTVQSRNRLQDEVNR